jgi:hypothetical protein
VGFVFGADAAVVRAVFNRFCAGVVESFAVVSEFFSSRVLVIIGPVEFLESAMLGAIFFDINFAVVLEDGRV